MITEKKVEILKLESAKKKVYFLKVKTALM